MSYVCLTGRDSGSVWVIRERAVRYSVSPPFLSRRWVPVGVFMRYLFVKGGFIPYLLLYLLVFGD